MGPCGRRGCGRLAHEVRQQGLTVRAETRTVSFPQPFYYRRDRNLALTRVVVHLCAAAAFMVATTAYATVGTLWRIDTCVYEAYSDVQVVLPALQSATDAAISPRPSPREDASRLSLSLSGKYPVMLAIVALSSPRAPRVERYDKAHFRQRLTAT